MKAWQISDQKNLQSLKMIESDNPIANYGEAVVAVKACALNHRDLQIMRKQYGGAKSPTQIPLSDMSGEIIAIGAGVTNLKPGDRVCATHFTKWINGEYNPTYLSADLGNSMNGVLAERISLPASCLVKIPETLDFVKSSTLPVAGATVWSCLQILGNIKPGDTVLLLGTGGVSVFALQLALINGAKTVITSSQDQKLQRMKDLGAHEVINYKTNPAWEKEVLKTTGGVDIVVETGGIGTLEKSIYACAPNARVGLIGALAKANNFKGFGGLLIKNILLKGITSGSKIMLEDFITAIQIHNFDPIIDKVFDFDQAISAYEYLDSGQHIGKIVIKL